MGPSLLSEWCVVTSFYQSLQAMSSFMLFSICATYCTLSIARATLSFLAIIFTLPNWCKKPHGNLLHTVALVAQKLTAKIL